MKEGEVRLAETDQWKAVAHPTRLAILRELEEKTLTNEELAQALGMASGKLHYHTTRLLKAGLIELSETRSKGALTEKVYRRVPGGYEIFMEEDGSVPLLFPVLQHGMALYRDTWIAEKKERFPQRGFNFTVTVNDEMRDKLDGLMDELWETLVVASEDPTVQGANRLAFTALLHRMPSPTAP